MSLLRTVFGLIFVGLASTAHAAAPVCAPRVEKAWLRAAPPGASMLAGYAVLTNPCEDAIEVVAVAGEDFDGAMIHESFVENGVSKMRHLDALPLPAHGGAELAPGGRHLMLIGPKRELKQGDRVWLSFTLADGREVRADFVVSKDAPAASSSSQ
jgi:copper(I)-binding protein